MFESFLLYFFFNFAEFVLAYVEYFKTYMLINVIINFEVNIWKYPTHCATVSGHFCRATSCLPDD